MSANCPNGHSSASSDYCDTCGAKIGGAPATAPAAQPTEDLPALAPDLTDAAGEVERCPDCAVPRVAGDRFCEGCGYDFVAGTSAQAPARESAAWEALVEPDRAHFDRVGSEEISFPGEAEARTVALDKPELGIGRRSSPEIDMTGAAGDPGISRLHAALVRQEDGSYAIVDRGSTNGTTVNDNPIAADVPVPVGHGDRVHLGAWTRITLRRAG